jgi:hypothetical protein
MSTPVLVWWMALCVAAIVNALAWALSTRAFARRAAALDPRVRALRRRQVALSAVFVLVCGFRSFFPRADVQRICLVDSWISSVFVGRSTATIAELAFVAQWALLLRELAEGAGSRFAAAIARSIVPAIAVAEAFSWSAVITTCYAGNAAEQSIWTATAAATTAAVIATWRRARPALRPFLAAAILCGAAYVLFMTTVDVPMYVTRFRADEAAGRRYLGFVEGVRAAATQWIVTGSIDDWREEMPWMALYFSVCVWLSIALAHVPPLGTPEAGPPAPPARGGSRWLFAVIGVLASALVVLVAAAGALARLAGSYPALEPARVLGRDGAGALDIREAGGIPVLFGEGGLPVPADLEPAEGEVVSLDGPWEMRFEGEERWREVAVPSTYNAARGPFPDHEGVVFFRRRFATPFARSPAHFARLRFEGVLLRAEVSLNGRRLGAHEGGYTPFSFDATDALAEEGEQNLLEVRADDRPTADSLPPELRLGFEPGWAVYGGIFRGVSLERVPRRYVCKAAVETEAPDDGSGAARLRVDVVVHDRGSRGADAAAEHALAVSVLDPEGREVARAAARGAPDAATGLAAHRLALRVPAPRLYEPGPSPALYTVAIELGGQRVALRTGLRRVEVAGERLLWNGRPLFLRGICKHEDDPDLGATEDAATIARDFDFVRALGASYVRLAHYPHSLEALHAARERGLLVSEEIPLYQAGMGFAGWLWKDRRLADFPAARFGLRQLHDPSLLRNAARQLVEMIERDRNNPAVILWSVGNECYDLFDGGAAAPAFLRDLARRFDASRPVTMATLTFGARPLDALRRGAESLDVLSVNFYFGWYYGEASEVGPYLDRLHAQFPGKPIVISECGAEAALGRRERDGPFETGFVPFGRTYSEEYQAGVLADIWRATRARPFMAGISPWVLADFRCPWFPKNPVPGYNTKGLLTRERIPKQGFRTLAALYGEAARADAPAAAEAARPLEVRLLEAFAPFYDERKPMPLNLAMPFEHIDEAAAPFVDEAHLARVAPRWEHYCEEARALGYTGLIVGNLIHLATFDGVPEGPGAVYGAASPTRARHERLKRFFHGLVEAAHARGLEVVIETDLPAYTPELLRYLGGAGPRVSNPRLFAAYRAAIEELFEEVRFDALSVRIGEGGGAYDERGAGYASTVAVKTVADARRAVGELLDAVERSNARTGARRRLLFRTWTVGLGELGALHIDPALYEAVFAPFYGREALVTVVKHVAMDFYDYVRPNPTIGIGGLRQIVELEARREYEGFGLFPNFRAAEVREHLARFRARPQVVGISVWPQNGGFYCRAPVFYRTSGGDEWTDANAFAYAAIARDAATEPEAAALAWARERAGLDAADAAVAARVLARSPDLVRRGLYVGEFARRAPALFGLDPIPPMLWLWWTRPIAAHGVLALLWREIAATPEGPAAAIAEGEEALRLADALLAEAATIRDARLRERLVASLRYERSLLAVLAPFRRAIVERHRFALEGAPGARERWHAALGDVSAAIDAHEAAYAGSRDFPAFDFRELRREVRDAAWLGPLRPIAALLAALAGALAAALGRGLGRRAALGRAAAIAAGAGLLLGAAAAVLASGYDAAWIVAHVGLAALASWTAFAAAARAPGGTLRVLAAPLLLAALAMGVFAARGPIPAFALLAAALDGTAARLALGATLGLPVMLGVALALAAAPPRRALLGIAAALGALFVLSRLGGPQALVRVNEDLRLGPSIFGEAGTGAAEIASR